MEFEEDLVHQSATSGLLFLVMCRLSNAMPSDQQITVRLPKYLRFHAIALEGASEHAGRTIHGVKERRLRTRVAWQGKGAREVYFEAESAA